MKHQNIILVCATEEEIKSIYLDRQDLQMADMLITGPGMVSTAYHLTKALSRKKYDLVINAGIAGSFSTEFIPGSVVHVVEECFSDLGIEDDERFINISEMGFKGPDAFPLVINSLKNETNIESKTLSQIKKVKGITVNTVHGNNKNIQQIKKLLNPDVETMEGAAVFYVCEKEKIPFFQLRSISNFIEKRDKSKWKTEEAIKNLDYYLRKILDEISGQKNS